MTKEEKKLEKERLKAEANLKRNGPAGFAKNFIGTQLVIMYLVIFIANIFADSELGLEIPRYIGVIVIGFLTAFFAIKKCLSLCTKEEYSNIKKLSHVYIGVVALVIFIYGLYSVSSNLKEAEATFEFVNEMKQEVQKEIADLEKQGISLEDIYSEEDIADIEELLNIDVEKTMQEARTEANIHWFVVALVYVVGTEFALFLAGKKVSIDSLPDSREDATPEKVQESTNIDNTFVQSGINPTVENNLSQEESAIQDNTQDIKFDL